MSLSIGFQVPSNNNNIGAVNAPKYKSMTYCSKVVLASFYLFCASFTGTSDATAGTGYKGKL